MQAQASMLRVTSAVTKKIVKKPTPVKKKVTLPKATPKLPPKKKAVVPVKKAVVKKAVVKKVAPVKKAVVKKAVAVKRVVKRPPPPPPPPVKRAPKPVVRRKGGTVKTGGWLGSTTTKPDLSSWYGPSRKLYLPPGLFAQSDVSKYLNGTLAGDYGYDPLGIGQSVSKVNEYRAYELIHARWAMLGVAGMIIPEGLAANGADLKGGPWFEIGSEMLQGGKLQYFAVPWGIVNNQLPLIGVFIFQVVLMFLVESYRSAGTGPPGYAPRIGDFQAADFKGLDPLNPGGPLDPFGLASDPEVFQELKVKEIKNGRLAMVAFLGYVFQAAVTGEGPYANWAKHVADPFGYNLLTVIGEDRGATL